MTTAPALSRRTMLMIVIGLQVLFLGGIALLQGNRIANGTEVRVAVVPKDPLDLARGAYVSLAYSFEELPVPSASSTTEYGYVILERPRTPDGVWTATKVTTDEGDLDAADAWIRLRLESGRLDTGPIDTSYESADRAKELERELADGGVATLSLSNEGQPTLRRVDGN